MGQQEVSSGHHIARLPADPRTPAPVSTAGLSFPAGQQVILEVQLVVFQGPRVPKVCHQLITFMRLSFPYFIQTVIHPLTVTLQWV